MDYIKFAKKYFDKAAKGRASAGRDGKYDKMLKRSLELRALRSRSMRKIGITAEDAEAGPFCFEGYCYDNEQVRQAVGKDGKLRSERYQSTWLYFAKKHIYVYTYVFSTTNTAVVEDTRELLYNNISDFTTHSESVQLVTKKGKNESTQKQFFSFEQPSGKFVCWTQGPMDDSVLQIRRKILEKQNEKKETDSTLTMRVRTTEPQCPFCKEQN
ncbi:MAG: hypothetical protein LBP26_01740 [Clostridiales bacterium]|jgi:hypothetical protein|nr:hypothetical protein [Clostridiales bacterium]